MRAVLRTVWLPTFAAAFLLPLNAAAATTTVCSNPKRAGPRVTATITLRWDQVKALHQWLQSSSETEIGMTFSAVASGPNSRVMTSETIILQSPKWSVAITIAAARSNQGAVVTLERTCMADYLEDWRPFWRRFYEAMRNRGYFLNDYREVPGDDGAEGIGKVFVPL